MGRRKKAVFRIALQSTNQHVRDAVAAVDVLVRLTEAEAFKEYRPKKTINIHRHVLKFVDEMGGNASIRSAEKRLVQVVIENCPEEINAILQKEADKKARYRMWVARRRW